MFSIIVSYIPPIKFDVTNNNKTRMADNTVWNGMRIVTNKNKIYLALSFAFGPNTFTQ